MIPSIRNFVGRRGSSTALLPNSKTHFRILSFGAVFTTSLLFFLVAYPHSRTSILNVSGLHWGSGAIEGLASLSVDDLASEGYSIFPADRTFGNDGATLTKEVQILDDECLEKWVANGESCKKESFKPVVVDVSSPPPSSYSSR